MSMEEEMKEGRYFPGQKEQDILIGSIEKYFSFPERSEQRAQIVQQITAELLKISSRWNNRAVRLWFNNNKRSFLKQEPAVTFSHKINDSSPMFQLPTRAQSIPPKKRTNLPRSSSVIQTQSYLNLHPNLAQLQQTSQIVNIMMSPHTMVEEQKGIESDLTQHLVFCANRSYLININQAVGMGQITMPSTLPEVGIPINMQSQASIPAFCRGSASEKSIENFACIECGLSNANGSPAIVIFDAETQKHLLRYQDKEIDLECSNNVPLIHYDSQLDTFFAGSGKTIKMVKNNELLPFSLSTKSPPLLTSAMTSWNNRIALGNRKKVLFYDYESINAQKSDPTSEFNTQLPSVTSIAACNDLLCIASKNSHSIHVTNGEEIASVLIGHAGSVTCLGSTQQGLLLSGSSDSTARVWDVRQCSQVAQLERHLGALTFVSSVNDGTSNIVLTGGDDHFVRAWDLRANKALFEIKCGTGKPISASLSIENKEVTVITNEETQTTALGFAIPHSNDMHRSVTNLDPNLCIKFAF